MGEKERTWKQNQAAGKHNPQYTILNTQSNT